MNTLFNRLADAGTLALAILPVLALAGGAHAQEQTLKVGDLSQPTQAAAFTRHLDVAANAFCDGYAFDAARAANVQACRKAVREEAIEKLTPVQREQLAANGGDTMRLASTDR